jgi:hypothetical protein
MTPEIAFTRRVYQHVVREITAPRRSRWTPPCEEGGGAAGRGGHEAAAFGAAEDHPGASAPAVSDALPHLVGMARRSLGAEPRIAGDMLEEVERAIPQLATAAALLRVTVDASAGGMLPPAVAMTAARDVVNRIEWANR